VFIHGTQLYPTTLDLFKAKVLTWTVTTIEVDKAVASSDFLVFKEDRERKGERGEEGLKANFRLSIMDTWSNSPRQYRTHILIYNVQHVWLRSQV
jgi:hypothetical protein